MANIGDPIVIPRMLAALFFRYMNDDVRNHNNQRPKRKTWTREDNQLSLHCYFRSNPSQRGYRKRMIEIWQECANFQTTGQRLADQVRTIISKGWFSDLEVLETHQKTHKQNYNTVPNTSNGVKQKQLNENELLTSENENTTLPNNAQPNNHKETLSQEHKINLENVQRIMNWEKTSRPSLRNIEWRKLKIETEKINQILRHIPTNNITELNELIYAGAKLVREKIGIPQKARKQARMIKQKKDAEICGNRKEKATRKKIIIQLEKINQKVLAKEGRLKRYRQRVKQYIQNRTFQSNERKFYPQLGGNDNKIYQQPGAKDTERFWTKIWKPKQDNERAEWLNNITRELKGLEEGPKTEIHIDLLKTTLKRIPNWKTSDHDRIHGFWFKKFTSIHDRLALEMNRCLQGA